MNLKGIVLSKISKAEKDKYHIISLRCETKKTPTKNQPKNPK